MTDNQSIQNGKNSIFIRKASGEEELFETYKLERSLRNAGADNDLIDEIVKNIVGWLSTGLTTKKIYSRAFSLLRRSKTGAASRYKLKQAIMELGPTGYPFENLIGKLFEQQGFEVKVGQIIDGTCVTHEMDVIATGKNVQHLVECKYSSDQGKQISVQVPLYVRSRVNDIIDKRKTFPEYAGFSFSGWVVTNTRFSADSLQYGNCSGLHLLGWDYPNGNGLKELIERLKIYPITILSNLTKKEIQHLLNQDIITCSQLKSKPEVLDALQLTKTKYNALTNEINEICN
ncbi:MAG: AT hook motif [Bacteroidetes bacterium GWB2_41_8]|nr:MAG: AT hook motif [Bacteroidetes bacterium GWB2_41_8]